MSLQQIILFFILKNKINVFKRMDAWEPLPV